MKILLLFASLAIIGCTERPGDHTQDITQYFFPQKNTTCYVINDLDNRRAMGISCVKDK